MRDLPFRPDKMVFFRALFLLNWLLVLAGFALAVIGLQMLHLPWVVCGVPTFGCGLALRVYGYDRWKYQEIENALDEVHATPGSVGEDREDGKKAEDENEGA